MSEEYKHIASLILKLRNGTADAHQQAELTAWSEKSQANQELISNFLNDEWVSREMASFQHLDWKGHWHNLSRNIPALQEIETDQLPMIVEESGATELAPAPGSRRQLPWRLVLWAIMGSIACLLLWKVWMMMRHGH